MTIEILVTSPENVLNVVLSIPYLIYISLVVLWHLRLEIVCLVT